MRAFISLIACQVSPPCALSRSLLATHFAFLLSHVALELLMTFRRSFLQCRSYVFQGTAGWVFGAFIVCFVSAFDCFKEFGFIFREPVRMVSFSSWLEVESCFFYDFGEDVKGLPFRFGFQEEGIDGFSEIDPFLWAHKKFPLESLFVVYLFGS
jgi:hypothetical protein